MVTHSYPARTGLRASYSKEDSVPHLFIRQPKVYDLLTDTVKDTNTCKWTKWRACIRNVQQVFTILKTHYLGASNTYNIVDEAELMLSSLFYTCEKCNFNFKKYVRMHKDAHTMM